MASTNMAWELEKGDLKRIAACCKKEDGGTYSADYVSRVLKGVAKNEAIRRKAEQYLNLKKQMMNGLHGPTQDKP